MFTNFPAAARNFFLFIESRRNYKKFMEPSNLSYFWHIKENVEYSLLKLEYESRWWRALSRFTDTSAPNHLGP